jgi:hypothetical protein
MEREPESAGQSALRGRRYRAEQPAMTLGDDMSTKAETLALAQEYARLTGELAGTMVAHGMRGTSDPDEELRLTNAVTLAWDALVKAIEQD